ncbi:hypothetical protein [Enterococcus faecalis]|uniref:hypothetical protein n=1 Tax=Enterococcus faecalis TaxID=1351 RepID=UPI00070F9CDC|nr:hypothetical protein [Enterococcus faecalis]KXF73970.1 hypothetical protein AQ487_03895 [Enterococcus faecalis]MBC2819498.1 hypothetical protein [Enterococcus faecalis]MBC2823131.1 hypothetical protein [Enterococcus faecalis]
MGLIYHPNESQELVANFQANITTCEQILNDLKTGNAHLVHALDSNQLSGAAFTAGKGMFTQLVMPTVAKADRAIQELKQKLQQYVQYTDRAGKDVLDEDMLNQQLQELKSQQYLLTSQIQLYQNQVLFNDNPELTTMYHNYANELANFMNVVQEDIWKVEEKLRKLHELNMNIASLFNGISEEFSNLSSVINVLKNGNFDSGGKFNITEKNKSALLDVLTDYGSGAVQDGFSEGIVAFLENMDTSMPNAGAYMHAYASGNQYWRNIHIDWDSAGYGKAVSNSMLKKGVQNVTVAKFGVGKAKISGLGALGFGLDYLQNRNDGESIGMAFTHTAATTAVASAGVWTVGASATVVSTFGSGAIATAGSFVSGIIVSNPIGWAIGAGIIVGGFTKFAYNKNFLGFQDGVKAVGKAIDSGLESIKSIFSWRKKSHA